MDYIDGFVIAVASDKKDQYRTVAEAAAVVFKEFGALSVVECWGDDVPPGKLTSFPLAVKCEADEVVVFSWVRWPTKAVRDQGMKRVMEDPRMRNAEMPFDGNRMIYGGFQIIVDA